MDALEKSCDRVEEITGTWGKWQCRLITLIMLPQGIFSAFYMMIPVFYSPGATHWCSPPQNLNSWTQEQWKNYSIPKTKNGYSECKMWTQNYTDLSDEPPTEKQSCQYGYDFDKSLFEKTVENEWDLVCEKEYLAKSTSSAYNLGLLIGLIPAGQLADIIGRKKTFVLSAAITIPVAISTAFMPNIWSFLVTRFLLAVAFSGCFTNGYVLAIELAGERARSYMGMLVQVPWCIGYVLLGLLAYLSNNWRILQLTVSIPFILALSFWWIIPESPRWLLTKGKTKQAQIILEKAAKLNRREISRTSFEGLQNYNDGKSAKHTALDLLRTPKLRLRTLNVYFNYLVNSLVYYGLSLSVGDLGGNTYINYFISGAVELPAYTLTVVALLKAGRRWSLCSTLVVAGLSCIVTIIIPKSNSKDDYLHWILVGFATLGKFCVTTSFAVIYLYSTELFPTVVRGVGVTSATVWARIGSIIAPYISLLRHLYPPLPMITFGIMAIIAGLLVLILPETTNRTLPETIQDAENFTSYGESRRSKKDKI